MNTVDADLAAVRILTRLGPEVVGLLLSKHHPEATGFCAGCCTPTRWPCDLAQLCQAAQDTLATPDDPLTVRNKRKRPVDVASIGKRATQ
jgi:hypothetical protein